MSNLDRKSAAYMGTEIDMKWWKRYRVSPFFARGNGFIWLQDNSLYFHKLLTKIPMEIKLSSIIQLKTGKWHAGQWCLGNPIIKVIWNNEKMEMLSSGFYVADKEYRDKLIAIIAEKMG